ncbi:Fungal specific transcription factor domain containing protein [Rhypophila sp. PSN 637]
MEPSPQQQPQQAPPTPDDAPYDTALVSEILKAKRKSRGIKSCFPCRHRKVRCDGGIPCSNCVRRDHASLCRTAVPNSASGTTSMQSTSSQAHRPSAPSIDLLMNPVTSENRISPLSGADVFQGTTTHGMSQSSGAQQGDGGGFPPAQTLPGLADIQSVSSPFSTSELGCQDVQHTIRGLEKIEEQIATLKAELLGRRHGYDTQSTPSASFYATPPNHHEPLTQSTSSKRRWGRRYIEGASGAAIFLGGRADPPATLGCHDDPTPRSTEDALHLDNIMQPEYFAPRTYPFTNLWTTEASLPDVCRTLPHNSDIIRYWQAFETYVFPFYPALVALEEFRSSMFMFLGRRSTAAAPNTSSASPSFVETTDPSWLALLFAVLACGAQFSDDAAKERDLRSKVFICSSFQCLRTANLFHKTDMNQIQAMALVGHSLRNNLETNSAWIFMGTTLRLAQSIGLHEAASMPVTNQLDEAQERRKRQAKHLWWTLVWQDTLLSITYDRPTTSIFTTTAWTVPYSASSPPSNQCPEHKPKGYTFAEAVFHVCQILLDRSRQEHASGPLQSGTPRTAEILEHSKRRLELTVQEAAPYFRDEAYCKTMQEHLERLALQIHVSYAACAIYRLCLDRNNGTSGAGSEPPPAPSNPSGYKCPWSRAKLKEEYIAHAAKAVRSFLDMYRLSPNVCRSWAFVHNAVSCAVTARRFLPVVPQLNPPPPPPPPPPTSLPSVSRSPGEAHLGLLPYDRRSSTTSAGISNLLNNNTSTNTNTPALIPIPPTTTTTTTSNPFSTTSSNHEFENLISELITVLEREEKQSEWRDADTNVRYFGPYSRALGSLKETYCQTGSGFKGCF